MVIEGIPGGAFVLEFVAAVTVVGAAYAHLKRDRDESFDVDRAVAIYSFLALAWASGLQVLWVVFR